MRDFRKVEIWHEAVGLAVEIHQLTGMMSGRRRWALINQMERASLSIPSNIAEGFGRRPKPDIARFLDVAVGSTFELETQLHIAESLQLANNVAPLIKKLRSLSRRISAYAARLRE